MALEAHEDVPWTEPYDGNNTHNEPRPDTVIYQQVFSDLRLYIQQCTDLLQDPLEKSGYSNVITEALLEDVRNRTKAKEPDDTMYSIEGEMESGKSCLTQGVNDKLNTYRQELSHQFCPRRRNYRSQGKALIFPRLVLN